jgi:hypothetical protein
MNDKLVYQGRPTTIAKSLNDDILVGWFAAEPTDDPKFLQMSRNMSEFLTCEMVYTGFWNQVYSDSLVEILHQAEQQSRRFCLLHQVGWWGGGLYHMISDIINTQYNEQAVLGLGGPQDLNGILLINIKWWVEAGRPDPKSDEFFKLATQAGGIPWPMTTLRRARVSNLHPAAGAEHHACMAEELDTDVFFCANTEDFSLSTTQDQTNITDTIITVAGGLSAVLLSYTECMPPGSKIVVIDNSPTAINMSRMVFERWDGQEYSKFIETLISEKFIQPTKLRGRHKLPQVDEGLKKIPGFVEWFNTVFKTYQIEYRSVDLLDTRAVKFLLEDVIMNPAATNSGTGRKVFINFSNVYHYMPTAAHLSYDSRSAVSDEVSQLIMQTCRLANAKPKVKSSRILDFTDILRMFPWR